MLRHVSAICLALVVMAASAGLAVFSTSDGYRQFRPAVAIGGGGATSVSYRMASLVGQTAIGVTASSGYTMHHGFYSAAGLPFADMDETVGAPPAAFRLHSIHPNPFNPATTIAFEMPRRGRITARIYNLKGRLVRTLLAEERDAGRHEITWNGLDDTGAGTASGVYLLRLDACDRSALRKLTLLK